MNAVQICKQCRQRTTQLSPEGFCVQCLTTAVVGFQAELPDPKAPPTVQELAAQFPQLEILDLLGKGGMGVVYRARQIELDRLVALKILPRRFTDNSTFTSRFSREARALAKLNHPGIVTVYDFGRTAEHYYFIMEYVEGMNLRDWLNAQALSPDQAMSWVSEICSGLQYAHDEGVIHRDIKPANILVHKKGHLKIADFGLAKLLGGEPDLGVTTSGAIMGTLDYMAPEQREDTRSVDHRADIYSLGVVFYEMLTGELPRGRFEPPSKRAPVDPRLDEVVLRALEPEPSRRYQRASELQTSVEAVNSTSMLEDPSIPQRASRWPLALLAAAALIVLVICLKPLASELLEFVTPPGAAQLTDRAEKSLEVYDQPGRLDSAIRDLQRAAQLDQKSAKAEGLLGMAYWRRYRLSNDISFRYEAWLHSSNALVLNPNTVPALFVQGLVANAQSRTADAVLCWSNANIAAAWEDGETLIQLARANLATSPTNVEFFAGKASQVHHKPWYFYVNMAYFERGRLDADAAQSNYTTATIVCPESPAAWVELGKFVGLNDTNQYAFARDCILKSIRLGAGANGYDGLGTLYLSVDKSTEAADAFHMAAIMDPVRYDFPGKEGLALVDLPERRPQGMQLLSNALDKAQSYLLNVRDPLAEANIGLYQAALGQPSNAYTTFHHLVTTPPYDVQLPANIGAAAECLVNIYHLTNEADRINRLTSLMVQDPNKH